MRNVAKVHDLLGKRKLSNDLRECPVSFDLSAVLDVAAGYFPITFMMCRPSAATYGA